MAKVIIDVGASKNFKKESVVSYNEQDEFYMFEPHPTMFKELVDIYAGKSNVHLWNFALYSEKGTAEFFMTRKEMCSSLLQPNIEQEHIKKRWDKVFDYKVITVPTFTLDSILGHLPYVDLLKLDTQGSEYDILLGSTKVLSNTYKVVVEVEFVEWYKDQKLSSDIENLLTSRGFKKVKERIGDGNLCGDYTFVNIHLK